MDRRQRGEAVGGLLGGEARADGVGDAVLATQFASGGLFLIPESTLRQAGVDLAVGYFPDARASAPDIVMETVAEERNVVAARQGHPACGAGLFCSGSRRSIMRPSFTAASRRG